ncbi:hypothetical protein BDV10DRAFT_187138 [Aspergillus recurvatus]
MCVRVNGGELHSRRVETKAAFEEAISSPECADLDSTQLAEIMMGKLDKPWRLQAQIGLINERNGLLAEEVMCEVLVASTGEDGTPATNSVAALSGDDGEEVEDKDTAGIIIIQRSSVW